MDQDLVQVLGHVSLTRTHPEEVGELLGDTVNLEADEPSLIFSLEFLKLLQ